MYCVCASAVFSRLLSSFSFALSGRVMVLPEATDESFDSAVRIDVSDSIVSFVDQ